MKTSKQLRRAIACGGLSLALVTGVGLPISARAASNSNTANSNTAKCSNMAEHHQQMRAMHEKMLAQAKAEDATLEKMVAELNRAPEAKKVDLEAAILTKLVDQRHQMLNEWASMHARHMQTTKNQNSATGERHSLLGRNSTQK